MTSEARAKLVRETEQIIAQLVNLGWTVNQVAYTETKGEPFTVAYILEHQTVQPLL